MKIKISKKNLVITIPIKKLKELLNESNEPTTEYAECPEGITSEVDTNTGYITGYLTGEQVPEVSGSDEVLSTPETTGDTEVQQ